MFNLSRSIVAFQVERVVARIASACSTCLAANFSTSVACKLKKLLQKVELGSTLGNMLVQRATMQFVGRQVRHAVVIRVTTRSTCNATMLRDKFKKMLLVLLGL